LKTEPVASNPFDTRNSEVNKGENRNLKTNTESALLSDIFSNLGQMVWSKDIRTGQTRLLTTNFSSVFEIPHDLLEMDPGLLKSSIHPDDAPLIDVFSKVLLSYGSEQSEYRIITPTGKIKWLSERKQTVKNDSGEIIRLDVLLTEITDEKAQELKLQESETTFKSLFYRHPYPMWVYDPDSLYFLAVNDAAIHFYGYTHDEFFKMTIKQIRPKEEVPELLAAIKSNNFEINKARIWKHLKKDGQQIHMKVYSNEINFRGKRARLVVAQDVTGQITAEEKNEHTFRYLKWFQDGVSQTSMLCLLDAEGKLTYVNENLLDKNGCTHDGLSGRFFSVLFAGMYRPEQINEMWLSVKGGKIWRGERKFHSSNQPNFWTSCTIIPIKGEGINGYQYMLLAHDISALKDAERQNRDIALRLHNIIEGVTDAIFVLDRKWHITNVNAECEHLLENKRNALVGKNIWEVFPVEESFKFYQFFRKAKKRKITVQFEEFFQPKNQWYDISIYPSKDGLAVCFRNVTDRRKLDTEKQQMMEQLVAQNRDLEEFTYITSHSLRAQIANISMLCSAMDSSGLTPSNHEIFEKLFQASANLDTIIGDLNTILTVKDRSTALTEDMVLQNIYINAISRIPYSLSPLKKHLRVEIQPDLRVHAVRSYVETIVFQIVCNALRFRSSDRVPDVWVQMFRSGKNCIIVITDNGRGMDLQKMGKQLFQLYKTFHPGTSGKGLGLYLSKILAEKLGATLDISSAEDQGTQVTLQIPI